MFRGALKSLINALTSVTLTFRLHDRSTPMNIHLHANLHTAITVNDPTKHLFAFKSVLLPTRTIGKLQHVIEHLSASATVS